MTEKVSEWVDLCDRQTLNSRLESCLTYEGFHENGFHLLTLTPRPFLEMRNKDNVAIYSLKGKTCTALEHFLRYVFIEKYLSAYLKSIQMFKTKMRTVQMSSTSFTS